MHNRLVELLVGIFVALGIGALVMLAMKVSNIDTFKDVEGYEVSALFDAIGGLKEKAPVTVAGVRVGRVKSIKLDNLDYQAEVVLALEPELMPMQMVDAGGEPQYKDDGNPVNCKMPAENCVTPLFEDASASILTAGLLGEQYIGLNVGGGAPTLLPVGGEIKITQSAIALEQIIGQFLFSKASEDEEKKDDDDKFKLE